MTYESTGHDMLIATDEFIFKCLLSENFFEIRARVPYGAQDRSIVPKSRRRRYCTLGQRRFIAE